MGYFVSVVPTKIRKNNYVVYECVCSCGNICYKRSMELRTSNMCPKCASKFIGEKNTTHGMYSKNKRLATLCKGAYDRCNNPTNSSYKNYGGRGVKFEFDSVLHMFNWSLENGYRDDLSIDRIDVNGNYSPSNCRWVTMKEQASNKTDTVRLGDIVGIKNIAKHLNLTECQLKNYLYKNKMTIEEIYDKSKNDKMFYASDKEKKSLSQRKRKDQLVISKEEAIRIVENIKNGSTSWKECRRLNKDHITIKRAIKRLEDGYYD